MTRQSVVDIETIRACNRVYVASDRDEESERRGERYHSLFLAGEINRRRSVISILILTGESSEALYEAARYR